MQFYCFTLQYSLSVTSALFQVSALCFNYDATRLLVGYARGHILMYDVKNGKLLRTMTDVHAPGTAVLHVKVINLSVLYYLS